MNGISTIPCLNVNSTIFKEQLTSISAVLNNTGNTTKLLTSFSALDVAQQKVLLSSKLLTEEQKVQCATMATLTSANAKYTAEQIAKATGVSAETLANLGLIKSTDTLTISELAEKAASDAQAKSVLEKIIAQNAQAVANGEVTASNVTLATSEGGATLATGAFTTAIKANIKAMWTWMTTTPVGWITMLVGGILGAVTAYNALTDSVEETKEKAEDLISTYKTALDTANSHKDSIDNIADRYEELSKGVNNLGENVSLTAEEYQEYNSIVNDIAEMFPTMVQGYTDEGNAILKLKGNVDALREAYEAEAQAAYNSLISTGKDSDGNDILKDANNVITGSTLGAHDWGNAEKIDYLDKLMDATDSVDSMLNLWDESLNSAYSEWFEDFAGVGGTVNIGKLTDEDLANIRKNAKILKQQYQAEIDSAVDNAETLANAYLMTNEDYAKLDEQSKNAASIMVNSLNADIVSKFGEDKENVGKYVDDIVQIISTNPDAKDAMIGLFTMDTTDMPVDDIKYWTNAYIDTIAKILQEDPAELKIRLGFDNDTTEPLKTKVKGFLKDEFDGKVGELTLEELEIASSKLEIPEGTLLSWDELIAKIREVQGSTLDNEIDVSFTDTLNSADNAEIKDELLELAKAGEITPEVLSSTEEYAELLSQTETSAESAMNQILDLLTAQEKLAGFSQGLDKLKSAYEEFKDEDIGFVTAETLESLPDAFKNLPEFDLFSQIVGDPTSGAEAIQQAFNDITKAYMLSQDVLQGLVGASEHDIQSYIANLKQMGVTNADEVVNLAVEALNSENELINGAQAEIEQAYQKHLEDKTFKYEEYLNNQAVQNVSLVNALGESYKGDYDNWCELLANKAKAYNEFITALEASGITYDSSLTARGNADKYANQGHGASAIADMYTKAAAADYASYKADQLKNSIKLDLSQIKTNFGTSYSPSTGSKEGSSGSKEETVNTETYDWIEKKLEVIAKKTEKAGNAFEKAFSLSSTNKKYQAYLSQINEEISANNSAIQTYQAKLNSIGLSGDWIARIQNGEYSITDVTDDALNERIGLYQEYYDKLVSCQETVEELQEKRLEVQNQYAEKVIGIYEREIEKLDRIIEKREALVKLKESFSGYASKSDLKYEQKYYQKELNSLEEQNDKLIKLRKTVKKNSDAWNTYTEKINENKSSILDLTQSIADLAEKLANLPLEKLERKLDKNDTKRSLNDAKLSNATSVGAKNSILNSQINLENSDNKATQTYAKETAKAVTTNIKSIKSAKNSDKKGQSKAERKKINSYYKQIQKYTKSKKSIPASLITKLANAGYSNLVQACSNYNESLDANKAAQETVKLTAEETKANINELKKQQFDNIQEDYSRKASQIQAKASKVDSKIALLETKGYMSSAGWYNEVIKYEKQNLANSQAELRALQAKQNEMTKYTDEWWEAQDAIDSVTQSINDGTLALQEYVNKQREIHFENFEFLQGQISRLNSEAEYFIDLMQNMELSGDNGITNYGLTAMGMYYQQIQTNLEMAEKYANMAKEIEQQLLKEPYNTDLLVDYQELVDKQREMITNNEALKKSIADLVKDGYETLLDSLGEVIDKYKEVLSSAKDAHDYQKNISDKTENINTLQKQIVAFSGMTGNDEVASKLQSLQAELKDAEEDLQETMYDKYISDTEEVLDEILNELETFIEELSKNTNELYEEGVKQIVNNTGSIHDTLKTLAETSDTPLSEQMESIWSSESIAGAIKDSALSSEITTAIQNAVSSIVSAISHMEIESDKQTDITAFNEIATKYDNANYAGAYNDAFGSLLKAESKLNFASMKDPDMTMSVDEIDERLRQLEQDRWNKENDLNKTTNKKKITRYLNQLGEINAEIAELRGLRERTAQWEYNVSKAQQAVDSAKQTMNDISTAQIKATENNKSVIKELLNSIANPYSLTGEDQTELDKRVSEILGKTVFLSEHNIEQLAKLLNTENNQNAVLQELEILFGLKKSIFMSAGFATGGIAKAVGEDGIALVRNGEGFVMPEHVPMIQGLLDSVPKIDALINTTLPNLPSNRGGDIAQTIEIGDIYMSGVNDPQEFSKQLISTFQNESKVQKMFGTFVNNSLTGKNSLGIRKY